MLAFGALSAYRREIVTVDAGYVEVANGSTTYINVPAGTILSAKVRWRGAQLTSTSTEFTVAYASNPSATSFSSSLSAPSLTGGSLRSVGASCSVSAGVSGNWSVSATPAGGSTYSNSGTGTGGDAGGINYNPGGSGASFSGSFSSSPPSNASFNYSVSASWDVTTTTQTSNPRITVGGQATQHTGTLNNNVESAWYDANGFTAGSNNAVSHNISGSAKAYVQIVVQVLV